MPDDTTPSTPTPPPADPTLQQRVAEALFGIVSTASETPTATEQTIFGEMARAVLAELAPELGELADYRNRITWETTCGEHAALLDACRTADERAEQAEAMVAELRETLRRADRELEQAATKWDANLDKRTADLNHRAEQAEAALTRVRELHRKANNGDTCVYCAHGQRLGYDTTWPCDTIRALTGQPATTPNGDPK